MPPTHSAKVGCGEMGKNVMQPKSIQISDVVDAGKTASDEIAASPACAYATAYGLTTKLCKHYGTSGGNFTIRFTTISGERTYFTIFVIDQGNHFAGIAVTLNVHSNQFSCNTFLNNNLTVESSSMTVGNPNTINIALSNDYAWGHVWVFPSDDVTSIS